ncbi:MAG: glyceraldehyde-3-phosphate dehydrogenase [Desulfobulbaceae bacterium BRH_c16a]|nr:MAG: glyceraldehyde-3-phosphate dehydrogenase [Desulfobulbaceae bacterium BRH_c16a]KJS02330.1 MAG: glyceraldehyde-3-phosphate dehydrogenase [Desulfobulbaceae bacterium BRH_c16a]
MPNKKVKVAINGYGVIGKRVADAVVLQDDMELAGICDIIHDYRIRVALEKGYRVFASTSDKLDEMKAAGIPVEGALESLLGQADVVVDCTPKKVAEKNRTLYEKTGVKAIYEGGEKHEVAGYSFVAQANYDGAIDRQSTRVVSCNTTALVRVLGAFHQRGLMKRARTVILRRATDPWESHKEGIINTVIPEAKVPSHQGPDAKTVIPELNLVTMAGSGSHNLSHIHFTMIETTKATSLDEVREVLTLAPRIAFIRARDNLVALNSVIELMRDLGRPRADMWEVAVWEDSMAVDNGEIYLTYQVHNEAITIPENIDAIRALAGIEKDGSQSIKKTDQSLGITNDFLAAGKTVAFSGASDERENSAARAVHDAHKRCMCEGFKGAEEPAEWD